MYRQMQSHSQLFNKNVRPCQELVLMHLLLEFGCPGQLGNHFLQPINVHHVQTIPDL